MSVISAGVSREEDEDVQIKQMALLTGLVDLVHVSSTRLNRPSRTTDSSPYAVAPFKYRHFCTRLRQSLGTFESRYSSTDNADYAICRVSSA